MAKAKSNKKRDRYLFWLVAALVLSMLFGFCGFTTSGGGTNIWVGNQTIFRIGASGEDLCMIGWLFDDIDDGDDGGGGGYTCVDSLPYCGGSCPPGEWCVDRGETCACGDGSDGGGYDPTPEPSTTPAEYDDATSCDEACRLVGFDGGICGFNCGEGTTTFPPGDVFCGSVGYSPPSYGELFLVEIGPYCCCYTTEGL